MNQFVGTTNVLTGEFSRDGVAARVMLAGAALDVPADTSFANGTRIAVSIRPEHLRVVPFQRPTRAASAAPVRKGRGREPRPALGRR